MKKTKSFMSQYYGDIEEEVNKFLTRNKVKLIDIKYNSTIAINSYNTVIEQYSALLIYEEAENDTEV
ncbi:TPA: sporulation protein Cse60 [Streptococcus suis]|nr:sporulation protein Cse60 [Streptococcus suis]